MRLTGEKLERVYEKYGGKAIYPPLFLFFFLLHFMTSLGMSSPATDPNELAVIAVGEFFTGKNWSGVMCSVNYYYGFVQGLLYTPALLIFNDAHTQYTAMLTINALLMSIVPLLAFSCARRLGAGKVWKELLTAIVAGGYCCYFAHAKFAWSETSAIIFPWIMLWLMMRSEDVKSKAGRVVFAILAGFVCALSLGAHIRLAAVVLAIITALIFQRVFYRKSAVPIIPFVISFAAFGTLVLILSRVLQSSLWLRTEPSLLNNTAASFFAQTAAGFASQNGMFRFFITLFGQLYYFVTATWGAGAVAFSLFGVVCVRCFREKKEGREQFRSRAGFAFFTFFSVVFTIITGTLYRFGSDGMATYQDTTLFGRFLDGVIPFALMFVMIMLFDNFAELKNLLGAAAILGVVYLTFFSVTLPVILQCRSTRISPILALYPLRIGGGSGSLLSFESLLLTASMTFCVMSLLIVVISCAKKSRPVIISCILTGLTVYSAVFILNEYVPLCRAEAYEKNSYIDDLSESVYDQNGAPTLTAYNLSRHEALMLQFLNQNVTVRITYNIESIPENCYLAVKSGEDVSALAGGRNPFLLVAENSRLRLYAYGERAIAYMQSQDIGENEDESVPLITDKPVSQTETSAATTAPADQTAPPSAERTTERTPMVSTHTTPAVVTVPADNFGTDDEWAIIE